MVGRSRNFKRFRKLMPLAVLILATVALGLCSRNQERIGASYASLNALERAQQKVGYLKIGTFGNDWPAKVVEIEQQRDGITFVRHDGTRHSYTGFAGSTLKLIRLQGGREEIVVIFRSAPNRTDAKPVDPAGSGHENPVRIL